MTGLYLKKLRIKNELTKHRLCEKLGIHISTLNNWERKDMKIHSKYYPRIRRIFDLSFKETFLSNQQTAQQKESLRQQRVAIMGRMDRKVERWGDLPNDDPDLVAFRKVVGAK